MLCAPWSALPSASHTSDSRQCWMLEVQQWENHLCSVSAMRGAYGCVTLSCLQLQAIKFYKAAVFMSIAGKDRGQEEKRTTEDELAGWYHRLNGHGFGWTLGVGDGQGGLVCCGSWGCKRHDWATELNWFRSVRAFHRETSPGLSVQEKTHSGRNLEMKSRDWSVSLTRNEVNRAGRAFHTDVICLRWKGAIIKRCVLKCNEFLFFCSCGILLLNIFCLGRSKYYNSLKIFNQ